MSDTTALVLGYPVSANRYWATRVVKTKERGWIAMTYVTPEAKAYKEHVRMVAYAMGIRAPIVGRVEIGFRLFPALPQDWATRRRKDPAGWADTVRCIDLGNAIKVMEDALIGTVIEDDSWTWRLVGEKMEPDAQGARLELFVRQIVHPLAEPAAEQLDLIPVTEGDKLLAALHNQPAPEF